MRALSYHKEKNAGSHAQVNQEGFTKGIKNVHFQYPL